MTRQLGEAYLQKHFAMIILNLRDDTAVTLAQVYRLRLAVINSARRYERVADGPVGWEVGPWGARYGHGAFGPDS